MMPPDPIFRSCCLFNYGPPMKGAPSLTLKWSPGLLHLLHWFELFGVCSVSEGEINCDCCQFSPLARAMVLSLAVGRDATKCHPLSRLMAWCYAQVGTVSMALRLPPLDDGWYYFILTWSPIKASSPVYPFSYCQFEVLPVLLTR